MKKRFVIILLSILMCAGINAQTLSFVPFDNIDQVVDSLSQADTSFLSKRNSFIQLVQNQMNLNGNGNPSLTNNDIIIPVVVHVLHVQGENPGQGLNLSMAQIQSQLDKLNAGFAATIQGTGQWAVDTRIRFCLAQIPAGPAQWTNPNEPGIMRYPFNQFDGRLDNYYYSNSSATVLASITHPTSSYFPFTNYLNIWSVRSINNGNTLGYSPQPLSFPYPIDGIVMDHRVFGDNTVNNNSFPLDTAFDAGTVLCHEAGHYFGLYHTFAPNDQPSVNGVCAGTQNSDCQTQGDFICDTPADTSDNTSLCQPNNSCFDQVGTFGDRPDMIENFMDYSDDNCLNTFTNEQSLFMHGVIQILRAQLVSPLNLALTGVTSVNGCLNAPYLTASINVLNCPPCVNDTAFFSTPTGIGFSAVTWQWTFTNATPSTATGSTPFVIFNQTGQQTVVLTATDINNVSITDTLQVWVSTCAPIQSTQGNWYFGNHSGLDFSSGGAVADFSAVINNTIHSQEATVSMSKPNGQLLFYSDGDTIWDQNHLPAISNLFGTTNMSKSQILALPDPAHANWYYLFHGSPLEDQPAPIYYSIIADSNNTIIPIQLNVVLPLPQNCPGTAEKITAIPHCNGRDFWIITLGFGQTPQTAIWSRTFFVYLLSPTGVTDPLGLSNLPALTVISANNAPSLYGNLKASPDGKLIATATNAGYCIFDFDNAAGIISNQRLVAPGMYGYGCSFSPNSKIFYFENPNGNTKIVYGIDLTLQTPQPQQIYVDPLALYGFSGMQLGPDSLLYLCQRYKNTLSVICNPNNLNSPLFSYNTLPLTDNNFPQPFCLFNLPNMVDAHPTPGPSYNAYANPINCSTYSFQTTGCFTNETFLWNFGDNTTSTLPLDTHNYSSTGSYTVTITIMLGQIVQFTDTFVINVYIGTPPISGPTTFCIGDTLQYTLLSMFNSYTWFVSGNAAIIGSNTANTVSVVATGTFLITCNYSQNSFCNANTNLYIPNANQSPIADAGPASITTCPGGIINVGGSPTATGGTPPYSYAWTPSAFVGNPVLANTTASNTITTTFQVLVTDSNGCTDTDTIQLITSPALIPVITTSAIPGVCYVPSSIALQSYFTPSGGLFSGPGVIGSSFDPIVAGVGTFTITYTYTDPNTGCSNIATNTIQVNYCCTPVAGINTADQDRSSSYGQSFNNNIPTPVAINGTFYIDNNFNITGFWGADHIRLGPDAKIVIRQNCRLTATASQFKRCDNFMWESIIIEPGGELVMSGCEVYDAKAAVTSLGGAKYTISGTSFFRNYIGLKVEPASGIHPGTIVSSNIVGAVLGYPPYAGVRSRYGIQLTQVDSIVIGVAGALSNENTIRDVEVGVYALTSKFGMVRNRFLDIIQPTIYIQPGCCAFNTCNDPAICFAPQVGVAVWEVGGRSTIGGTNAATDANRFKNCTNGILIEADASIIIRNNEFQQIESPNTAILSYSIWVRRCKGVFHWITDNSFATSRNGIFYEMNSAMSAFLNNNKFNDFRQNGVFTKQNPNVSFTIQSNQFNTQYTGTPGKYGIRVQNAVIGQNISLAFITGNIIKHVDKGIWLTKAPYSLVTMGNQVEFQAQVPSITSIGIQVQNSEGTLIDANGVLKLGAPPSNDSLLRERLYGISVEYGSFNSNVSNNNLSRVGSGIHFYGTSNYPSTVNCNLLVQNMAGIRMNNSFIGDQGAGISVQNPDGLTHDNLFTYNYTNNGQRTFYRNVADLPFSWYCRTSTSNSPTTNPPSIHMDPPLTAMNLISAFPSAPQACYYQNPSPQQLQQQELALIALRAYPFDSLNAEQLVMADQTAMKQLKDNPSLMSLSTPYDAILMDYYLEQLGESVERTDEVHRLASEGDTLQARIVNDGIVPANCIEASQKTVNTIYLKTWAQGIPNFSPADSALLYMVATENVNNCGTAVYDARVMLDLDVDDFGPDGVHRPVWLNDGNATKGKMYPNPTSGDAVYERELKEQENGYIEIMDLPGHIVLSKQLLSIKTGVPASTLTNGLYLYRVYVNGKLVDAGKLAVLH
jgi:hypothetical protein